jgi:hypothetical protein
MPYYLFEVVERRRLVETPSGTTKMRYVGFTEDEEGRNLPQVKEGRWTFWNEYSSPQQIDGYTEGAAKDVADHGFHIAEVPTGWTAVELRPVWDEGPIHVYVNETISDGRSTYRGQRIYHAACTYERRGRLLDSAHYVDTQTLDTVAKFFVGIERLPSGYFARELDIADIERKLERQLVVTVLLVERGALADAPPEGAPAAPDPIQTALDQIYGQLKK